MAQSARLEIHELNVGQGDSILIINRDLDALKTAIQNAKEALPSDPLHYMPFAVSRKVSLVGTVVKALLIDAGDDEYGDDVEGYATLMGALEVKPQTVFCPKLSLLVSHFHDDHMAGLRSIFKRRIDPQKKGDKAKFVERYRPAAVYMVSPDPKAEPGTARFANFSKDVKEAGLGVNPTKTVYLDPGGFAQGTKKTATIDLGTGVDGIPIKLYVLAAAQAVYSKTLKSAIRVASVTKKVDQNDRSVVMVLEYGSFRYFVGGDIAGNGGPPGGNTAATSVAAGTKKYYSSHADVESTLGPALKAFFPKTTKWKASEPKYPCAGYCTVMKANHHASSSSVDTYLLSTLQPRVLVVSSGIKTRFHDHPTQQVIDRATVGQSATWGVKDTPNTTVPNSIDRIYLTEVAAKVKNAAFGVDLRDRCRIVGDVVIRPVDETVKAVQDSTAPGQTLTVQVYGYGDQTTMKDPDTTLRPTVAKNSPANANGYVIGPWTHSDTH
jgi:beta-lactamase superfamily II metal-dependent hydrolase